MALKGGRYAVDGCSLECAEGVSGANKDVPVQLAKLRLELCANVRRLDASRASRASDPGHGLQTTYDLVTGFEAGEHIIDRDLQQLAVG